MRKKTINLEYTIILCILYLKYYLFAFICLFICLNNGSNSDVRKKGKLKSLEFENTFCISFNTVRPSHVQLRYHKIRYLMSRQWKSPTL